LPQRSRPKRRESVGDDGRRRDAEYDLPVSADADELAALRRGLLVFCYQLLGSPFDAEDAVQDTMERAWRSRDVFDPQVASLSHLGVSHRAQCLL
jgi:DNA-directed RNA polymerase specialized sigma24 family protein